MADTRQVPETRIGIPDLSLAKNGDISDGSAMATLANQYFSQAFRRQRVLYSMRVGLASSFTSGVTHYGRFLGAYDVGGYYCTVMYTDAGVAGNAGFTSFNVNGVAQSIAKPAHTGTVGAGPSDFKRFTFALSNVSSGSNDINWTVDANSGINSIIIYGGVVGSTATYANFVPTSPYLAGAPVRGSDFFGINAQCWDMFQQMSTNHFNWDGVATLSTTYTNILDGSTGGWALTSAGFWTIPYRQATMTGTTVPAKFWVRASSTGTTGRVRLVNGSGVLGTITGIGAAGYYSMDVNLDPTVTSDLVIVEASEATAAKTITVNGVGLYNFTT